MENYGWQASRRRSTRGTFCSIQAGSPWYVLYGRLLVWHVLTLCRGISCWQGPSCVVTPCDRYADPIQSSLVLRFVKDQFDDYRESTIGAAFLTQTISLDENTTIKFEIWDTAGQERYKSLAPMYYRNANCAVVVYDVTQAVRISV